MPTPRTSSSLDETAAVEALSALAQPHRLRVFRALIGAGLSGLTPGALSVSLGIAASSLSFHLRELSHAGLVSAERDGRHLIYRPAIGRMNALLAYLTAHCCHGTPCDLAEAAPAPRKSRARACTDC